MNRNTIAASGLVLAVVVLLAGLAAGGVAADTEVKNGTINVTNGTDSVYVDVSAVSDYNGSTKPNVTVSLEGLQDGEVSGEGVVLLNESRTLSNGTLESYEYALDSSQLETYDRIEYTATSTGDGSLVSSVDAGTVASFLGGGGGGLGTRTSQIGVIAVVLVGFFLLRGGDDS